MKRLLIAASAAVATGFLTVSPTYAGNGEVTLIHMGDIHGHLVARHNLRSDGTGRMEGGLARMYTKIKQIRARESNSLLINTGDTIQGSAEALFTKGQALVDVLNLFKIDAYTSGNWDFLYGTQRYLELFAGAAPKAPWQALAANLYYKTLAEDPTTPYPAQAGQRVLPPYMIKKVGNVKIGILGMTTQRGIAAVGPTATKGFKFTNGKAEAAELVPHLRNVEGVDMVVMISELELGLAIRLAEATPGIDVILSADMHEETRKPIVVGAGTIIVEEGQDGTQLGELELEVVNRKVRSWEWKQHHINTDIAEDKIVAATIAKVRKPFLAGPGFVDATNPINGAKLKRPINTVVGYTAIGLHRSNFSHEPMPAVVEGSSHDFLTDAFRAMAGTQVATLRGFRYGTHVPQGPITMEHLYHFLPIGAGIATAYPVTGQQLKNQVENSTQGVFSPNPDDWTGGWMFGYSGMTFDFDVWQPQGSRGSNIRINGQPLDVAAGQYSVAGYWYADAPNTINNCVQCTGGTITPLRDAQGNLLDATEVVVNYLQSLPGNLANPELNRVNLLSALPAPKFGFYELQPLRGATP